MSDDVACPSCRRRLQVPDEADRRDLLCPGCGERVALENFLTTTVPPSRSKTDTDSVEEDKADSDRLALFRKQALVRNQSGFARYFWPLAIVIGWVCGTMLLIWLNSVSGIRSPRVPESVLIGLLLSAIIVNIIRLVWTLRSPPEVFEGAETKKATVSRSNLRDQTPADRSGGYLIFFALIAASLCFAPQLVLLILEFGVFHSLLGLLAIVAGGWYLWYLLRLVLSPDLPDLPPDRSPLDDDSPPDTRIQS